MTLKLLGSNVCACYSQLPSQWSRLNDSSRSNTQQESTLLHDSIVRGENRNVLDCDQSNYSSRIIFSYTFTLEPNTNWTGWTVSAIWPLKIIQDGWRPWSETFDPPTQKPYTRTKREADRMIRWRDMAVRNFPKCEVGRSVVGPQYIHCSHVLLFATLET